MRDQDADFLMVAIPVAAMSVLAVKFGGWPWLLLGSVVVLALLGMWCRVKVRHRRDGLPVWGADAARVLVGAGVDLEDEDGRG